MTKSTNRHPNEMNVESPIYQAYVSVAPKPEDWSVLVAKVGQLLRQDYDWSAAVASIKEFHCRILKLEAKRDV